MQLTITFERVPCNKAEILLKSSLLWHRADLYMSYTKHWSKSIFQNISRSIHSAEKEIFLFFINDCGDTKCIENEHLNYGKLVYFNCKQDLYPVAQIDLSCKDNTATYGMNHLKNACKLCIIPRHDGAILCRFKEHRLQANLLSLKAMGYARVRWS